MPDIQLVQHEDDGEIDVSKRSYSTTPVHWDANSRSPTGKKNNELAFAPDLESITHNQNKEIKGQAK